MGDCGHAPSMCPADCHALDAYLPRTPVAETIEDVRCKLRDAVAAFNECDYERERTAIEREEWKARALAAEADLALARQHGLLAAAWVCPECDCSDSWTLRGRHSTECASWGRDEIAALADNGPPMAACADCDGFGGFSVYGKPSGTIVRPCETCDGEGWLAQDADRDG